MRTAKYTSTTQDEIWLRSPQMGTNGPTGKTLDTFYALDHYRARQAKYGTDTYPEPLSHD